MIFRTLRARLLVTYLLLTAIGLGGVILWTGSRLQATAYVEAGHAIELQAHLIANALRDPLVHEEEHAATPGRSVVELAQSYARQTGSRVTLYDEHMQVVAASDGRASETLVAQMAELASARNGVDLAVIRREPGTDDERLYTAVRIEDDREHAGGYVQLSMPLEALHATLAATWLNLIASGLLVLVAIATVSIWLAQQIAQPLMHLTAATGAIAAGDLNRRITPEGPIEVQRLGDSFNRMADQVCDTLAKQRAFVGDAAHELRSPLTSLRLRLDMIRSHGEHDASLRESYLASMARELESLQRLVERLFALSALDQGQEAPRQATDLAPLLYDVADDVSPLANDAGVALTVDVPEHLGQVFANGDEMRIVIRNLLDNAVKYTPAGGQAWLSARATGDRVSIVVRDTGIGIAGEDLPHIFDRFFRADKARTRKAGGTGVGLSLVQAIVAAHGGSVTAESFLGQGTTLTVWLPLRAAATQPQSPAPPDRLVAHDMRPSG
ncbi:MAG: HAMP domain-containing histidine kinase [Chloroflexi bacterium]|nr:HAMP domain-containing histidine kinase [Chloroflexota bacterium]